MQLDIKEDKSGPYLLKSSERDITLNFEGFQLLKRALRIPLRQLGFKIFALNSKNEIVEEITERY